MYEKFSFLTENEMLFETLKFKRLLQILKLDEIEILNYSRSNNSYGEFLFITTKVEGCNVPLVFYGFGLHEYRGEYFVDKWKIYTGNTFELEQYERKPILETKIKLLRYLKSEYKKWKRLKEVDVVERDNGFCMVSDMADEDYAISNYGAW